MCRYWSKDQGDAKSIQTGLHRMLEIKVAEAEATPSQVAARVLFYRGILRMEIKTPLVQVPTTAVTLV